MTDDGVSSDRAKGAAFAVVFSLLAWVLLAFMLAALVGCTIRTLNNGEIGFEQSTKWVFIHRTSQTGSIPSESQTDWPSLEAWIKSKAHEPPQPQAVVTTETKSTTIAPTPGSP